MITLTLTVLFVVVFLATALALTDAWLRARSAFDLLSRERALVKAGFVPIVEASEIRLRPGPPRLREGAMRPFARRVPQAQSSLADVLGAA